MDAENFIEQVRAQCTSLINAGIWPAPPDSNHEGWLDNFDGEDRVLAAIVLQQLVLFSDQTMKPLLRRAFKTLLQIVAGNERDRGKRTQLIDRFLADVVFCPIEGEIPNITDSGGPVCRRLRKVIGINEKHFMTTKEAVDAARLGRPVVLVDDFVGTGEQLFHTWRRSYAANVPHSFQDIHSAQPFQAYLLAVAIAEKGRTRAEGLGIAPCFVHVLRNEHSLKSLEPRTEFPVQSDLQDRLLDFLRRTSTRLNLPSFMQNDDFPAYGLDELALTIGFPDSVPDATLPLIWAPGDDAWKPLKEQT